MMRYHVVPCMVYQACVSMQKMVHTLMHGLELQRAKTDQTDKVENVCQSSMTSRSAAVFLSESGWQAQGCGRAGVQEGD